MSDLIIRQGRLLDPASGVDRRVDLAIRNGRVHAIADRLPDEAAVEEIDATGKWVLPGFVDPHVHLRTPGQAHKETIETGAAAAAAGGYTRIVCMPNTTPPLDNPIVVEWLRMQCEQRSPVHVEIAAAITEGQQGQRLTDFGALKEAGAVALTDDGVGVSNAALMRHALELARHWDLPIMIHAEDPELSDGGAMHAGAVSDRNGIPGIPAAAEAVMVARDVLLAEMTGARLHVLHVSAETTVALIRWAKARGIRVSAEVSPHHLLLTDEDVEAAGFDPNWKMNPPLRARRDRDALIEGLLDGTIDFIATDHAPHERESKETTFVEASFGIIGLETAFALIHTHFADRLSPLDLARLFSSAPAKTLGLPGGRLAVGDPADLTIFDPAQRWTVSPQTLHSLSRNTPFLGRTLQGRIVRTLVAGRTVYALPDGAEEATQ